MEIIRRSDVIANAVDRYEKQYGDGMYPQHSAKIPKLRALSGDQVTAENINRIIGNESWTTIECDECGASSEFLVGLGEDSEWGGLEACVCEECLSRALSMLIRE